MPHLLPISSRQYLLASLLVSPEKRLGKLAGSLQAWGYGVCPETALLFLCSR